MKKTFALLLALVLALTCLTACGSSSDSDLKYIQKKGTMIVGITDYAPMDYKDENGNWNGMTITDEVTLNTNCTAPYVVNAQVLVMKADAIGNYADTASLSSLTFAVENGSAGQDAVMGLGIPETQIVATQDQAAALMEVSAGTSDACVIDITMAKAMTGEGTSYADLAPGISLTSEEYGVGFRKDSDVTAKVNEIMDKLKADGTMQALADKYSLTLAD